MKNSLSLIELILAIVLFGIIILAATTLDIASLSFFKSSTNKAKVLNDASRILEHIQKQALQSHGWINEPGYFIANHELRICIDDPMTPDIFHDDRLVRYLYNPADYTLEYCSNLTAPGAVCSKAFKDTLSRRVKSIKFDDSKVNIGGNETTIGVTVEVTTQLDPSAGVACGDDARNNPCAQLQGNFHFGAHSFH